ncbi:MAG: endo-1,4-beta-xylanase [Patescibacteria group bacterium]
MIKKIIKLIIIAGLILLLILVIKSALTDYSKPNVKFGVSFSPYYAEGLGLQWPQVYNAILDDLQVDHLRLAAYWDKIEISKGIYDFTDLDWQMDKARDKDAKIVLVVGKKLPRWPECYTPNWANYLSSTELDQAALNMIETTVKRYQSYNNVIAWQVENEPFVFWFGVCPSPNHNFFDQEIALVKKLDSRPVIITDSGELSTWLRSSRQADIFGTTLYRIVWSPYIGFWYWPLPPSYYYYKGQMIKKLYNIQEVIVSELQAEPWAKESIVDLPLDEQFRSMNPQQFKDNIQYARQAGFDQIYLWGAEWWYWMKEKKLDDSFWLEAKKLWLK